MSVADNDNATTDPNDERTRTAWHEAGHALVCSIYFGNVARVSIVAEGDRLGLQQTERFFWRPKLIAGMYEASKPDAKALVYLNALYGARWCLAGDEAVRVLGGPEPTGGLEDYVEAGNYLAAVDVFDAEGDEADIVRAWLEAHRPHLAALAVALLEHDELTGEQVAELLYEGDLPELQHTHDDDVRRLPLVHRRALRAAQGAAAKPSKRASAKRRAG